jgi:hypothetical protein
MMKVRFVFAVALLMGACSSAVKPVPQPTAHLDTTPDLVGFSTLLDATASTPVDGATIVAWSFHFVSVPSGSAITDDSLVAAGDGTARFEPDLGGDYSVELIVRQADGLQASAQATVTVPTEPVFYYEGLALDGGMSQLGVAVMRSDGTNRHLINCPLVAPDALKSLRFAGLYGMRRFEPDTGPVRSVFLEIVPDADGGVSDFRLWAADENSGCNTQPAVRIDTTGFYNDHAHFWPRFSPSGQRVLYVDKPQDLAAYSYRLVTVGFDDTQLYVIRSGMPKLSNTPPVWVDDDHIAWAEDISTTSTPHLVIYQASDQTASGDSATTPGDRTILLDCDGPGGATGTPILQVINQIEIRDGVIYVAGATGSTVGSNPAPMQIYRMTPGSCSLATVLASEPPGGLSWDFALSPDGRTMAFSSTGGAMYSDLYTVAPDGSSPPRKLAGDPDTDDVGPLWIAGGRQLVWTAVADEKPVRGTGVMIANADGTHVRSLYAESAGAKVIAGSNMGVACDYANGAVPIGTLILLAAILLVIRAVRRGSPGRPGDRR